ncbi:5-oxoprolinase subunit PxpA [Domibacillus sp. DTU_2020_1001157_1_SI_ALB_TIR_016]|uniref:LamB/YcsF family protein n=1 Tax=Domibacillus sp. DTU_2020_1001157_1_SI_ALB_TIR_016 TaxID=3077789 RepID=UPI0028E665CF|nr:5-oxoprolinase subunit PxpA [Domibacillus sp. DTU_2020_1001157_1_SI_ALB_TIR_016]WNS80215.1 5-oxoprolinase subunit PxpA [Domibacillus sp. DTU_2020_1001157_1_SI_ALB_TIR_016]
MKIDINCDMGESFGAYSIGHDKDIMPYITSANIACGFHAGDPDVMKKTVHLAMEHGVKMGAHPGFQDLAGFGRRNMALSPEEVYSLVVYQIGALQAFVQIEGTALHHVKPHGALYNMAASNEEMASAIAAAVKDVDTSLILYGLAGSKLVEAGQKAGLKTASEVFADRTYTREGMLTPRRLPHALIEDSEEAVSQVIRMAKEKKVRAADGTEVDIQADTVCIHGDGPHALSFARLIRTKLQEEGIDVRSIAREE